MKSYPDPQQHFEAHIQWSAARYVRGLQRAGLSPNAKLTRAMAERAVHEAKKSYTKEADEVLAHNIDLILSNHQAEMNEIKRSGHKMRLWTCPPIAALFGLVAWYHIFYTGDLVMAMLFIIFALAFLGMLIGGAIFDRPTTEKGKRGRR